MANMQSPSDDVMRRPPAPADRRPGRPGPGSLAQAFPAARFPTSGGPAFDPRVRSADEPTQMLPTVTPRETGPGGLRTEPLGPPAFRPEPPTASGRAVLVYEPEPRRKWGLLVFTAVMVALTTGVVLGQAVAWQPVSSSAASAQTVPDASYSTPPVVPPGPSYPASPSPSDLAPPVSAQRVSAPLGAVKAGTIEVTGAAELLQIRSADLGDLLFDVVTTDSATTPAVEETRSGPRLILARNGPAAVTGPVGILLSTKVKWTIRLSGGFTDQQIDMRSGRLAGIEMIGDGARAALDLPKPTGTVPITVTGRTQDLRVRAEAGVPVRLRLAQGADTTTVDGKQRQNVAAGTTSTTTGWSKAKNRYDVKASARPVSTVVEHAP